MFINVNVVLLFVKYRVVYHYGYRNTRFILNTDPDPLDLWSRIFDLDHYFKLKILSNISIAVIIDLQRIRCLFGDLAIFVKKKRETRFIRNRFISRVAFESGSEKLKV